MSIGKRNRKAPPAVPIRSDVFLREHLFVLGGDLVGHSVDELERVEVVGVLHVLEALDAQREVVGRVDGLDELQGGGRVA